MAGDHPTPEPYGLMILRITSTRVRALAIRYRQIVA